MVGFLPITFYSGDKGQDQDLESIDIDVLHKLSNEEVINLFSHITDSSQEEIQTILIDDGKILLPIVIGKAVVTPSHANVIRDEGYISSMYLIGDENKINTFLKKSEAATVLLTIRSKGHSVHRDQIYKKITGLTMMRTEQYPPLEGITILLNLELDR